MPFFSYFISPHFNFAQLIQIFEKNLIFQGIFLISIITIPAFFKNIPSIFISYKC